jgi:type II secretory pathway pseudopilin PulG
MKTSSRRSSAPCEDGFSLIEVLVAALMLILIVTAAAALFAHGEDSSISGQRESELISVADQQMETIRREVKTMGFNNLVMESSPTALPLSFPNSSYTSSLKADPDAFAKTKNGCGPASLEYEIESNYGNNTEPPPASLDSWSTCDSGFEPLEIDTGDPSAVVSQPQQTSVAVGSDTAVVDTFVTDTYVGCVGNGSTCPAATNGTVQASVCTYPGGSNPSSTVCTDARRVIVAVALNDHGKYELGPVAPVYLSAIFTDPVPSNEPTSSLGLTLGLHIG